MRLEDFGVVPGPVRGAFDARYSSEAMYDGSELDVLFDGLDGRIVRMSGRSWRVILFSVCETDGQRWVQLALRGHEDYALTLCLNGDEDVDEVLCLVKEWLADPANENVAPNLGNRVDDSGPRSRRSTIRVGHDRAQRPA